MKQYVRITKCSNPKWWYCSPDYRGLIAQVGEIPDNTTDWAVIPTGLLLDKSDCEPFQFAPLQEDQHLITTKEVEAIYKLLLDRPCPYAAEGWKLSFPQVFAPAKTTTYKIGQRIVLEGEDYILGNSDCDKVTLICLTDGRRYDDGVKVLDVFSITEEEMKKLTNRKPFTLLPDSTDQAV